MFPTFVEIPKCDRFWLTNARIPLTLLNNATGWTPISRLSAVPIQEDLIEANIEITGDRITQIVPNSHQQVGDIPTVDLRQGLVWPCFVDMHTHLDKGQTWERRPNPDGKFSSALKALETDRLKRWGPEDLYRRMEFGLKCSYAHGTLAVRTHLDLFEDQLETTLPVFRQLQREWRDRIALEAVCLVPIEQFLSPFGEKLADAMAEVGGLLGGIVLMAGNLEQQLDRVFTLAAERGLNLDFHTDESLDPADITLRYVAQAKARNHFSGQVTCGHCCTLSVQSPEVVAETLKWVSNTGVSIVSLPMCNLYLQDREPGRMPRMRGVTLLHEIKQQGIPLVLASDNCRDAFFAYGDHDGLEVFTQSARIGHLDRPYGEWPRSLNQIPAEIMGLKEAGCIGVGLPADLVLFSGRTLNEIMARSQRDRVVLRKGKAIDTMLPDYAELDDLLV
ncbi:MAG: cytosine deaminase [Cyanobacteria bacterium P01_D01_bin.128]